MASSSLCRDRRESTKRAHVSVVLVGLWIILNAVAMTYCVTHANDLGVREFLEHLQGGAPPVWSAYSD
jgi:hypothetical protein